MNWFITNIESVSNNHQEKKCSLFKYYTNSETYKFKFESKDIEILIDGYIIPKLEYFNEYKHFTQYELVKSLFKKYDLKSINYIKGVFNVFIIVGERFYIFNDRHSIKKLFIYKKGDKFFISNNLKTISENIELSFNKNNAAIFCLMEHFIDGLTLFNDLFYSKPATIVKFDKKLIIGNYWLADELLNFEKKEISYSEFANKWKDIVQNYIEYLKPKDITMTLTGGNDSRMILSALLNIGIKPNAFTFGNPESNDGVIAQKIANKVNLNYHNYFVENPSPEWFNSYAEKIIDIGNSLINIHRAHRLDAIEKEVNQNPDNEMIFTGNMGGEYIKGIVYDDYITSKLYRLWPHSELMQKKLINNLLLERDIIVDESELDRLHLFFSSQYFLQKSGHFRDFIHQYNIVGAIHHTQDMNLYLDKIRYLVNPFMDIDFLEVLFRSGHSMLSKDNASKNQLKRLTQSSLYINITHSLAPQLSNIEYAKKGFYTANELLGSRVIFISKRILRYFFPKQIFPANFPYEEWIQKFCKGNIVKFSSDVKSICDFNGILKNIDNSDHKNQEKYWHRFTDLINIDLNVKKHLGKYHE